MTIVPLPGAYNAVSASRPLTPDRQDSASDLAFAADLEGAAEDRSASVQTPSSQGPRQALQQQRTTALLARRVIQTETVPGYLALLAAGTTTLTGSAIAGWLVDSPGAVAGGMAAGMASMTIAGVGLGFYTLAAWGHTRTIAQVDAQIQALDDR